MRANHLSGSVQRDTVAHRFQSTAFLALVSSVTLGVLGCSNEGSQKLETVISNAQQQAHTHCDADIATTIDREAQNVRDALAADQDANDPMRRLNGFLLKCRARQEAAIEVSAMQPTSKPPSLPALDRAISGPLTVTGFTLGQSLPEAECKTVPPTKPSDYTDGLCWQTDHELADPKIKIVWFDGTAPPIGFAMRVYLDDGGVIDGFSFETLGVQDQEEVLQKLSQKYGKPTTLERRQLTNLFGARALAIHAEWDTRQAFVEFDGVNDRFDRGWAHVDTAADHKRHLENQRRLLEERPHL